MSVFKKKRHSRFLEESTDSGRFWLGLLIGGLLLFAWNEIGGLLRLQTPFSFTLKIAAGKLDTLMDSHRLGGSLLHNILVGKNAAGRFEYGLVPEAIHFLLLIAPIIFPLGVLLARSRRFAHELGIRLPFIPSHARPAERIHF